ncbi:MULTISPECIES: DUF1622 domain-containing protein [unclassified Hyphomicrobium]|uniref:DUF1622 domain-containing protein n=1 Tax=unclassified Hyphomicrobium TaxID=2619925 RepID=UPI000213F4B0|nr:MULTISPECIES: DUF1622 domain-containing protein [unclassified Hyphomicrobium]CCB66770.1 conserved protein of unknown function [Hyphomicrobium sp. MC1]
MEAWFIEAGKTAVLLIDAVALLIIVLGTIEAFVNGSVVLLGSRTGHERRDVWLRYARWLVAGLTFQLAADIIETSITTDWQAVARLAAVALIRTMLNFFLERDLEEVRDRQRRDTDTKENGEKMVRTRTF